MQSSVPAPDPADFGTAYGMELSIDSAAKQAPAEDDLNDPLGWIRRWVDRHKPTTDPSAGASRHTGAALSAGASAHDQQRHFATGQHPARHRALDQARQRAVTVRAHHHQIEFALAGKRGDLLPGVADPILKLGIDPLFGEERADRLERRLRLLV